MKVKVKITERATGRSVISRFVHSLANAIILSFVYDAEDRSVVVDAHSMEQFKSDLGTVYPQGLFEVSVTEVPENAVSSKLAAEQQYASERGKVVEARHRAIRYRAEEPIHGWTSRPQSERSSVNERSQEKIYGDHVLVCLQIQLLPCKPLSFAQEDLQNLQRSSKTSVDILGRDLPVGYGNKLRRSGDIVYRQDLRSDNKDNTPFCIESRKIGKMDKAILPQRCQRCPMRHSLESRTENKPVDQF